MIIQSKHFAPHKHFSTNHPYLVLLIVCSLIYGIFIGQPLLRTAGDEKVYIAQALEMLGRNSWFMQTLANEPNYYKGPLHYIFLILGFKIFGTHTPWAVLWQNILMIFVASCCLTHLIQKTLNSNSLVLSAGLSLLTSSGIYAFVFASQMEAELVSMYTFSLWATFKWRKNGPNSPYALLTWILVGLAGWFKSPLHSVLLGVGLVGYGFLSSEFRPYLKSYRSLAGLGLGVSTGICALLLPWLLDPVSFEKTYILRESLQKGANEITIWETFVPTLTWNLFPFAPMAWFGCFYFFKNWSFLNKTSNKKQHEPSVNLTSELGMISICQMVPTFLFFAVHPYRSHIYTLPCIPAIIVIAILGLEKIESRHHKIFYLTNIGTLAFTALTPIVVILLGWYFKNSSNFLPTWLIFLAYLSLAASLFIIKNKKFIRQLTLDRTLLACVPFLVMASATMSALGQAEIESLVEITTKIKKSGYHGPLGFYNAQKNTWSEWGLLNVMLPSDVKGLHTDEGVILWLKQGHPLILKNASKLPDIKKAIEPLSLDLEVWHHFSSHHKNSVKSGPAAALKNRDLKIIQKDSYVLIPKKPNST